MTLLESVVALVILGLAATGFLEIFQQTGRSTRDAGAWSAAVSYAEEGVEAAKIGGNALDDSQRAEAPVGLRRRIELRPWRGRIADLVVTVTLEDGRQLTVRRLVSAR